MKRQTVSGAHARWTGKFKHIFPASKLNNKFELCKKISGKLHYDFSMSFFSVVICLLSKRYDTDCKSYAFTR